MAGEAEPEVTVRRRGSWGRALERVRNALHRRRTSSNAVPTLATTSEVAAADSAEPATAETNPSNVELPQTIETPTTPVAALTDSHLEADDKADDMDDNEELLTPMFSSRLGINEEKAQAFYEGYGMKYQTRTTATEAEADSPNKCRRVERPIRMRIHWTCHECFTPFGRDRTCAECGHRRCQSCARSPGKRVKAIMDEGKLREEQEASRKQILAAVTPSPAVKGERSTMEPPRSTATAPIEQDLASDNDLDVSQFEYTIQQRPRSGTVLAMRPKAILIRPFCHECQTPFRSNSTLDCEKCSHVRCPACPRRPVDTPGEQPFIPTMVATVQRVHRKPRQRVRWTCDKCDAIFTDGNRCRSCDHRRCEGCVRSPAKRMRPPPDPAVVQSVNDRIEAWQHEREQPVGEHIPAGPS